MLRIRDSSRTRGRNVEPAIQREDAPVPVRVEDGDAAGSDIKAHIPVVAPPLTDIAGRGESRMICAREGEWDTHRRDAHVGVLIDKVAACQADGGVVAHCQLRTGDWVRWIPRADDRLQRQ